MTIEEFTNVMKALSDSNRVRALAVLQDGELCVCQLIELLRLAPSTVSKHMSILKQAKLVCSRKAGRWIYYRLADTDNASVRNILTLTFASLSDSSELIEDKQRLEHIIKSNLYDLCRKQRGTKCCP